MAALFHNKTTSTEPKPKTHISTGTLPPYISPEQPPTKKSPWRQINSIPFISSLIITLPKHLYTTILSPILSRRHDDAPTSQSHSDTHLHPFSSPRYAKVILPLSSILTTPFFTTFIKTGTIQLLSSGRPGTSSWTAYLLNGTLHLEMARELYTRCGLQGTAAPNGGGARKHTKERWIVEMDLRSPACVPGRNGFDRLIRAANEVLNDSRVWLFRDLSLWKDDAERERAADVLTDCHPTWVDGEPEVFEVSGVLVPDIVTASRDANSRTTLELHEDSLDVIEWLDLVHLGSPRVLQGDSADPYISRYSVPGPTTEDSLTVVRWTGLLDREWVTRLLIEVIRESRRVGSQSRSEIDLESKSTWDRDRDCWLALTVNAHRTEALGQVDGCTVLLQSRPKPKLEPGEDEKLDNNEDVDEDEMDVDGRDDIGVESQVKQDEGANSGLQHFTCFQFVGTVVT